ncbi:Siderophore synthetase component [Aquimarina amphilecti]|uniref:Siderophore synthetase component n=1 Tax=Aquimarina amphilecti TaxID=1038014 RepID=A0A1H7S7N5_AQUAM|nr:GNAT family N-acetyltransferase [Aquimarina amphilecti]SEL67744.1 Siderophore synthetase component [Aquimarina amphilecti]
MENTEIVQDIVFSRTIENFGTIHLRHLDFDYDIATIHKWVTKEYARYWGMLDDSIEEVHSEYTALVSRKDYDVFIGTYNGVPIFLMEKYKAATDRISDYYSAKDTDYGMHILVAPSEHKITGFTWNVFSTVLEYFFELPDVKRIVVEPDVRNEKIHRLNKKAGFIYRKEIELPEKTAALAFCEAHDYRKAKNAFREKIKPMANLDISDSLVETYNHLNPSTWARVNRTLVSKAISEFSHELLFKPQQETNNQKWNKYVLIADTPGITYEFKAQKYGLDHWGIDETSIIKKVNGRSEPIDALKFIIDFVYTLEIPKHLLSIYLEEISSTLSSAAYKEVNNTFSSRELIDSSFQVIEHAMSEGHPCFVANNGRIGFDSQDYLQYAPETNLPFKIYWLAGHKSKTTFTSVPKLEYKTLMRKELGIQLIARFNTKLESLGLDSSSYIFIPVHPWQWNNKILQVFAADVANQNLVFLGEGEDYFSAQQSIRTLYNKSNPEKMYTKTALSILNMGFMRGLSPSYMKSTPHITNWITELLGKDTYLKQNGFSMLGEVATVGFQNTFYEVLGKTNAHNKMLSALWRESPHSKIKKNQQLMTMAALLHVDTAGNSLIAEHIKASTCDVNLWIRKYLNAYLTPLLHCFYHYGFVFMPHGENIIMVFEKHIPVKILMKDITEEVIVFNEKLELPEKVKRLYTETSDKMKVLSIFTDVFDCFFRFMTPILDRDLGCSENEFWQEVASCIHSYQSEHPELQSEYEKYDLFVEEFDRCCLNRLQLKNTQQMLNLADPMASLILEGTLQNPIAKFKKIDVDNFKSELVEDN